ncbi:hypothetical protein I315_04639 [Cryptococcus gattii Ru294]|nr:hypothetical protein I315_04639 [Cryptococcus gattii Ru294]
MVDLGAPIGSHHQSNIPASEQTGFNSGVGGEHASAGATRATGTTGGVESKLDNALDHYSTSGPADTTGTGHHSSGLRSGVATGAATGAGVGAGAGTLVFSGQAVSGQYSGGGTRDALTGQTGHTTGAGVGYYGENLPIPPGAGTHPSAAHHSSTAGSATRAEKDAVGGAYVGGPAQDALTGKSGATTVGEGVGPYGENLSHPGTTTGTGVGPSGGAGGHYGKGAAAAAGAGVGAIGGAGLAGTTGQHGSALGAGEGGISGTPLGPGAGDGSTGAGITTGVAGVGAGAGAAGAGSQLEAGSAGAGKHGRAQPDEDRGAPLSDPKELDTGGPHSLVYQESTGKYVHRHELEGELGSAEATVKNASERRV